MRLAATLVYGGYKVKNHSRAPEILRHPNNVVSLVVKFMEGRLYIYVNNSEAETTWLTRLSILPG